MGLPGELASCSIALLLSGCAAQTVVVNHGYQGVEVPVSIRAVAPPALLAPVPMPTELIPRRVSTALTAEGEAAVTLLVAEYVSRIAAWHTLATP